MLKRFGLATITLFEPAPEWNAGCSWSWVPDGNSQLNLDGFEGFCADWPERFKDWAMVVVGDPELVSSGQKPVSKKLELGRLEWTKRWYQKLELGRLDCDIPEFSIKVPKRRKSPHPYRFLDRAHNQQSFLQISGI